MLRDDFRADSDVDFLYTPGPRFQRGRALGPWGQNHMAGERAIRHVTRVEELKPRQPGR